MSEPVIRNRLESFKGTVDELVSWCMQRELDPTAVEVTGTHLRFQSPETPEEAQRRAEYQASAERRHREWERGYWQRLIEKYGPAGPAGMTTVDPKRDPHEMTDG